MSDEREFMQRHLGLCILAMVAGITVWYVSMFVLFYAFTGVI